MRCWAGRDSVKPNRSYSPACRKLNANDLGRPSSWLRTRPCVDPSVLSRRQTQKERWEEAEVRVSSQQAFPPPRSSPGNRQTGGTPAVNAAPSIASQPPLPPLPIERGDNTLTRTLSGLILGAFGSLCIYSGGLLFTSELLDHLTVTMITLTFKL